MAIFQGLNNLPVFVGTDGADHFVATDSSTPIPVYGLAGDDIYEFRFNEIVPIEEPGAGTDTVRTKKSWTLGANFENLQLLGTDHVDATGNAVNNVITGNDGDNVIDGDLGNDTMIGGLGNDTYRVDSALDIVTEALNAGTDTVQSTVTHILSLNVENLLLLGVANINGTGNALDNDIDGNTGNNVIPGLGGDDVLEGEVGNDTLDGGEGNDPLNGGAGNDSRLGGGGNDRIDGDDGVDTLNGGLGNDPYVVDALDNPIVEAAGGGDDTVFADFSYTLAANVETLCLDGGAAINGTGNATSNLLFGNAAANVLTGLAGNDTLDGQGGADRMLGGLGNDSYVVDNAGDVVVELLNEGVDKIFSSVAAYRLPDHVENAQLAGAATIIHGNALVNSLTGNEGFDELYGYAGDDRLDGGLADDRMQGGLGNDTYVMDNSFDQVIEFLNEGTDTILSSVSITRLALNVENVTLTGAAADDLSAWGNAQDNIITGDAGDNFIDGLGGFDTMAGGLGDDQYVVGAFITTLPALSDKVVEAVNAGTDTVYAYTAYVLPINVERLVLGNTAGAINGTGNAVDNEIRGNAWGNVLDGGLGNDTLLGFGGDDALLGGGGNDSLDGGSGIDNMQGGLGDDTYFVNDAADNVLELAGSGTDTIRSTVNVNLTDAVTATRNFQNVENLVLLGAANTGTGNALNNIITGNVALREFPQRGHRQRHADRRQPRRHHHGRGRDRHARRRRWNRLARRGCWR